MTTQQAKDRVQEFLDAEVELDTQLQAKKASRGAVEQKSGEQLLAAHMHGEGIENVAQAMNRVDNEVEALRQAIHAARAQRGEAIKAVWTLEAKTLRQQAGRVRSKLDDHDAKLNQLLSQIEELEGCKYMPLAVRHGMNMRVVDPGTAAKLRAEVANLEAQAGEIEKREVSRSGRTHRSRSVEDAIASVVADSAALGPAFEAVRDWVAKNEKQWREEMGRIGDYRGTAVFNVVWSDCKIDLVASHVKTIRAA